MDLIPREQDWIHPRQLWSKRYVWCVCVCARARARIWGQGAGLRNPGPCGDRQGHWQTREADMVGLKGGSGHTGLVLVPLKGREGGCCVEPAHELWGVHGPRVPDVAF